MHPPIPTSRQPDCAIRCHAFFEARYSEMGRLRDEPSPPAAPPLPARFLRHCDEHTVTAVRAVLAAIATLDAKGDFDRCGVIAAPCQAGRIATARSLAQLRVGGGVMISPHIVPQCSLHSLAGAVSVALGMHGPHIGVGGGPDALAEGLFAALSLFQPGAAAGCNAAWVIVTEWATEPLLDTTGAPTDDPLCRALAMLVAPAAVADQAALTLSLHAAAGDAAEATADLVAFARALDMCASGSALAAWSVTCPWGAQIRVAARPLAAAQGTPPVDMPLRAAA
ncbi:MAG: hypothetical protein K8S94_15120 [Planctomycetia bacterium]|nr:hypothetical protein [Planctomycetia bacterium]